MQAVKGFLENGQFIPHEAITMPDHAEVTILFHETVQSFIRDDEMAFWAEFDSMTAESADENEKLYDEAFRLIRICMLASAFLSISVRVL